MADSKAALLRSLKIDRTVASAPPPAVPSRWTMAGLLLGGIALGGLGVWLLTPAPAKTAAKPAPAAAQGTAPATAQPAAARGGLVASGYVIARRKATVAAEITGRVSEVLVEEGMAVEEGQVLGRLDASLSKIELSLGESAVVSAQASVESLSADLRDARETLARTERLSSNKNASEADLIRARARAQSLTAQLRGARAQLETARIEVNHRREQLAKYEIRAPFAGIVVDKNAQPGEIISPISAGGGFTRTGICTLVDMASLEIEVDVNEAHIGRVSAGQKVEAALDAYPDWKIPAAVIAVVPTANREKATIRVRIALQARDPRILPDMAIKVTFLEAGGPAG